MGFGAPQGGGIPLPPSPSNGQVVTYNATTGQWEAATPAASSFMGCLLGLSSAHTLASSTSSSAIDWTTEEYDTDSLHDLVTNPDRITIPAGGTGYWEFVLSLFWEDNPQDVLAFQRVSLVRASADNDNFGTQNLFGGFVNNAAAVVPTPPVYMEAGDYAQAVVLQNSGSPIDLRASDSFFSARKVG